MTASAAPTPDRATPVGPTVSAASSEGRLRSMVDLYLHTIRIAVATQFQYRVGNYYMYMIGMLTSSPS